MNPYRARIPLLLLTGFLGSGKTTLLRELLADPEMKDTAVVINELGAVGLDHHLVEGATESMLVLENGCICCSVRDDFIGVLNDLFWNRLHRKIPNFSRVVIETTGVASPGPIVQALLSDSFLAERYLLQSIVTTVDAVLGAQQLERHWESIQQAAAADMLLITKADLASPDLLAQLDKRLADLNPLAERAQIAHGRISPDRLFRGGADRSGREAPSAIEPPVANLHGAQVKAFTVRFKTVPERSAFLASLAEVLREHGDAILRVKGLVDFSGEPSVVQAVGNTLFPLQTLPAWPDGGQGSYLVFITAKLDPSSVYMAFERTAPGLVSLPISQLSLNRIRNSVDR